MNGSSGKNPKKTNPIVTVALVIIALTALSLSQGCNQADRSYDGRLSADYSRLTVYNSTPWPCAVTITPADNSTSQSAIWANIDSQQSLTWDLIPGNYQLTAVAEQGAQFQTPYNAPANTHRRWPIINR